MYEKVGPLADIPQPTYRPYTDMRCKSVLLVSRNLLLPSLRQRKEEREIAQLSRAWNGVKFLKFINPKTLLPCLRKSYNGPCFPPAQATQKDYSLFVEDQL